MEKIINLIKKINEHNFIDVYIVTRMDNDNNFIIESIPMLEYEEAKKHCEYLNKIHYSKHNEYKLFKTCIHI